MKGEQFCSTETGNKGQDEGGEVTEMASAPTPIQPRRMVPAFRFNEKTFVWRCDHCAKMFFIEVEEALSNGVPRLTLREFESHSCAIATTAAVKDRNEDFKKIVLFSRDDQTGEERA